MKSSTFHASLKSKHVEGEVGKGINTYNIYGQAHATSEHDCVKCFGVG